MSEIKTGTALYKKAAKEQVSVSKICELTNCDLWLVDNGDGHTIAQSNPRALLRGEFADCLVESIMPNPTGCIVLWLPRDDED